MRIAAITVPLLLVATFVSPCLAGPTFHDTVAAARKEGRADRPVVLYFTASWCGWCRRLDADVLSHDKAAAAVERFAWVKVDIDEQKELAARYRVRGVPVLVVIDARDEVRGSRAGYQPVEKLVEFLESSLKRPAEKPVESPSAPLPEGDALRAALESGDTAVIASAVSQMALAERGRRAELLAAFADVGKPAWAALAGLMEHDRLAVRAAAAVALEQSTQAGLPFHPFAPAARRKHQVDAWATWLASRGVDVPRPPAEAEIPAPRPDDDRADEPLKFEKTDAPAEAEIP